MQPLEQHLPLRGGDGLREGLWAQLDGAGRLGLQDCKPYQCQCRCRSTQVPLLWRLLRGRRPLLIALPRGERSPSKFLGQHYLRRQLVAQRLSDCREDVGVCPVSVVLVHNERVVPVLCSPAPRKGSAGSLLTGTQEG
jgi:hypothetical protein